MILKCLHIQYHTIITSTEIDHNNFVQKSGCVHIVPQESLKLFGTSKKITENNDKNGSVPTVKFLYISIIFS